MRQVAVFLAWSLLLVVLAAMPAVPEIASTVAIIAMVVAIPCFALNIKSGLRPTHGQVVSLAGAAILAIALIPTTRSPENYFVFLAVLPVALSVPLSSLFRNLLPALDLQALATMAIIGLAAAAAITGYDIFVRGIPRGGMLTMNPIHMGDIAILLGFLALSGTLVTRGAAQTAFLLGPVLALAATLWSGSRGPLAAFIVLGAFTALFFAFVRLPRRPVAAIVVTSVLTLLATWVFLGRGGDQVAILAAGDAGAVDESTGIRLMLYRGALDAFLESPFFGHGGARFMAAAAAHITETDVSGWEHLHSDLANFAVIGGIMGLVAYLCFLLAPVLSAWERRREGYVGLYVALVSAGGVFGMGLTNTVIGILSLTTIYAVIAAALDGLSPANH